MSLTIEDLKKMTLPVRLVSTKDYVEKGYSDITVLFVGNKRIMVRTIKGEEYLTSIDEIDHCYKLAPKVKIVEVDSVLGVGKNGLIYGSFLKTSMIDEIHIKRRYHIDEESGEVLKVEVL